MQDKSSYNAALLRGVSKQSSGRVAAEQKFSKQGQELKTDEEIQEAETTLKIVFYFFFSPWVSRLHFQLSLYH